MWCDKELEDKRKLWYYKEVINPNLEDQKYLSILTSVKNKISIAKIKTNSHELHSEIRQWTISEMPWDERIYHICDTKRVEDENQFLIEWPTYTHNIVQFQNICHNTGRPNFPADHNYGNLGMFFLNVF